MNLTRPFKLPGGNASPGSFFVYFSKYRFKIDVLQFITCFTQRRGMTVQPKRLAVTKEFQKARRLPKRWVLWMK